MAVDAARAQGRFPEPSADRERRLVRRLRAREEAAFAELVEAHTPPLLRVAESYTRSRAVAEEVVQDTFLGVVTGIDRFEERSSLRTWLFRILANCARHRAATESRTVPFSRLTAPGAADGAGLLDAARRPAEHWASPRPRPWVVPEERLLSEETLTVIERAIARLPETQRRVIALRDVHGWPAAEVCAALGVTPGHQRVLLHRARRSVRAALARYAAQ